jgi:hypothetical protein
MATNVVRFDPLRDPFEEIFNEFVPAFFQPITGRRREPQIKLDVWGDRASLSGQR